MANIHLAVSQEENAAQQHGSGSFSVSRDELRVEEITTLGSLLALREEWTELLENSHGRVIFTTPEWIITWWQLFGHDDSVLGVKTLWTLAVRQGKDLVGLAPLMIIKRKRFGLTLRLLEFLGGGFGDYSDFILHDEREIIILNLLWEHIAKRKVWDIGILDDFSGFTNHASLSEKYAPAKGLRLRASVGEICPHVRISGSWDVFYDDAFKQRVHGGRRKKELRRFERKIENKGKVIYGVIHGRSDEADFIEKMAEVQRCGGGAGNLFIDSSRRLFLERFTEETVDKDWVKVSTLEVDGKWVAYYFGFYYDNRYCLYNTNFIQDEASCSPGSLLMIQILKNAFEEGLEEVDFMRGAEAYKFYWSNGSRQNTRLEFYHDNLIGRLTYCMYMTLLPYVRKWLIKFHLL